MLIVSSPGDVHARAVRWGAQLRGHEIHFVDAAEFILQADFSYSLRRTGEATVIRDHFGSKIDGVYDVLWARRVYPPKANSRTAVEDQTLAESEALLVMEGILARWGSFAAWINEYKFARAVRSRIVQAHAAASVGLAVPDLLVSNDPVAIREFFDNLNGQVVCKLHNPAKWVSNNSTLVACCEKLKLSDLADDDSLRAMPLCYQKQIERQFEVRVTVFGGQVIGVSRYPAFDNSVAIDIKLATSEHLEVCDVPKPVATACSQLLKRLGLVFGCLDFIVDLSNEWHFLEINESGQFLWLEKALPQLGMLQSFIELCERLSSCDSVGNMISYGSYECTDDFLRTLGLDDDSLDFAYKE